jgi:ferredoxin-thioredoxin reductase catalytic subunit
LCSEPLESNPEANTTVTCGTCGTKNRILFQQGIWFVEGVSEEPEKEIRDRAEEFARLRSYKFNELKERIIQSLIKKREKYGDFYCPCKARTILENVCPCKETRDGSVESKGRCTCGLFWKQ